eukprot:8974793-Lingulodinium_polyedra.AAC.1
MAPKLIATMQERMNGPAVNEQQMVGRAKGAPMYNCGLAMVQATVRGVSVAAVKYSSPKDPNADTVVWSEFTQTEHTKLRRGTYAVVKCFGEDFLRMIDSEPAELGEACGHAGLAAEMPVVFA